MNNYSYGKRWRNGVVQTASRCKSWHFLCLITCTVLCAIVFRYQGKVHAMWQTTWQSRWMTLTQSPCRSRASRQQNVGKTCTSCSTSTPSSLIPLGFWRKAPQRTACQVVVSFQQSAPKNPPIIPNMLEPLRCILTSSTILFLKISFWLNFYISLPSSITFPYVLHFKHHVSEPSKVISSSFSR